MAIGSIFQKPKAVLYSSLSAHKHLPQSTPLKIHKLTREEMDECQLKGLCYNYDQKYFLGHKCKEKIISMAIFEDVSEEDVDVSHSEYLPQ